MTYRYKINFNMVTGKTISFARFREYYQNNDEAKEALFYEMQSRLPDAIVEAFAEQGETVSVIDSELTKFDLRRVGWQGYDVILRVESIATIETESDYFNSPIAPLVIIAIAKAIAIIMVGLAVLTLPFLIFDWLKSMSTESWVVEKFDADGNLISRESGTKPSGEGMTIIFAAIIIIIIIAMLFSKGKGGS